LDARHLLLDRRRDRLLDGDGIGPGVGRLHADLRRHDVRVLGDGEAEHRDGPTDDGENGDYHRNDRPVDEEMGHGSLLPGRSSG